MTRQGDNPDHRGSRGGRPPRSTDLERLRKKFGQAAYELIVRLDALLRGRFGERGSRKAFVDFVNGAGGVRRDGEMVLLTEKTLSNHMGSHSRQPNGPAWYIAESVVTHCVPDQDRDRTLATIAWLWREAHNDRSPPGYHGEILPPRPWGVRQPR